MFIEFLLKRSTSFTDFMLSCTTHRKRKKNVTPPQHLPLEHEDTPVSIQHFLKATPTRYTRTCEKKFDLYGKLHVRLLASARTRTRGIESSRPTTRDHNVAPKSRRLWQLDLPGRAGAP